MKTLSLCAALTLISACGLQFGREEPEEQEPVVIPDHPLASLSFDAATVGPGQTATLLGEVTRDIGSFGANVNYPGAFLPVIGNQIGNIVDPVPFSSPALSLEMNEKMVDGPVFADAILITEPDGASWVYEIAPGNTQFRLSGVDADGNAVPTVVLPLETPTIEVTGGLSQNPTAPTITVTADKTEMTAGESVTFTVTTNVPADEVVIDFAGAEGSATAAGGTTFAVTVTTSTDAGLGIPRTAFIAVKETSTGHFFAYDQPLDLSGSTYDVYLYDPDGNGFGAGIGPATSTSTTQAKVTVNGG